MSLRHAAAVLSVLAAVLVGASTAAADASWHDGQIVSYDVHDPCLGTNPIGGDAWAGYMTDPAATRAGDVFYAHAVFGAATYVGGACGSTDQAAELDLVLPPGVSLAIDAQHPIVCSYYDDGGPTQASPTCPTHTVPGAYGPMLPAGDGGAAWDMPPGRTLGVAFPLVSTRGLKGAAEGHCPQTLNEISSSPQRGCLLLAMHMLDGSDDPWLLPNVQMVVAPGAVPPVPAKPALAAPERVKLSSLLAHGLTATITVPTSGTTVTLTLEQGAHTLGKVTRKQLPAGRAKVRVTLSRAAKRKLRRARSARLTLIGKVGAATLKKAVLAQR